MKKALLIADSGGTKTDWCLVDEFGSKTFFSTESYHPHLVSEEWIANQSSFWKKYTEIYTLEVHFYGAGCSSQTNQAILKAAFIEWEIERVTIESDLIGAAKACFGDADGTIGILGTGSVVAEIQSGKITQIIGGLGYLLGDEGSGYYFGKLLLERYLKGDLSNETNLEIASLLGSRELILKEVYASTGKRFISEISRKMSNCSSLEIKKLHEENIALFATTYIENQKDVKTISFIGSYAFYNENILRKMLQDKGYYLEKVVKNPIDLLADYWSKKTL